MVTFADLTDIEVRCRAGSLEITGDAGTAVPVVRCRAGSLEKHIARNNPATRVRCRAGSLEIPLEYA